MSRRFLATYVALALVVLAALEIPLGIQYGRSERRDLTGRIERDALTMATFAEDTLERGLETPPAGARPRGEALPAEPGRPRRDRRPHRAGSARHEPAAARAALVRKPTGDRLRAPGEHRLRSRHSNTLRANLIYVAVPVASGGRVRGAIRITYPTSTLDSRVRRYWLLLAAIGGVVLATATVVGLRFARTLTEPLSALERTAAAVGGGDLQARAPADSGPPEVRALAAEFNETVARLNTLLRSQKEFVADASHQLRTPLAALQLRLENLERDVAESGKPDLEAALSEVTRLARLVHGLLTLARADAARSEPAPIDLAALVRTRVDAWSAEAAARGLVLDARVPARAEALATPGSLEQVLDNLISNALAVSRPGQTITIEGDCAAREVTLHVRDDGPGMTAEQRSRAFDRFWRAGSGGGGTGLGLAIVHRLVTADGGTIELRDAARGGLDVVITLPAASPSSSPGMMDHARERPACRSRARARAGRSGGRESRSPRCRDRAERSRRQAQPARRAHPAPAGDHERPHDTATGPNDNDHPDDDVPRPDDDDHPHDDDVAGPDDDPAARRRRRLRPAAGRLTGALAERAAGRILAIPGRRLARP